MSKSEPSYCAEQFRRFDNDRFICTLFAPPAEREALAAIHAFNVEIARIREVTKEPLLGQMRLQWWREAIDGIFDRRQPAHLVAIALHKAVHRFGLDRHYLERVLTTRALDLEDAPLPTVSALIDYADGTSATLALLSLQILGASGAGVMQAARDVGIAWALVGLIRAVPYHAGTRRVYLPTQLNREASLDVFELFEHGATPGLSTVVGKIGEIACAHLFAARSRRQEVSERALPALLPATLADIYLAQLKRSGFNPFDRRVQAAGVYRLLRIGFNRVRGRY